VTTNPNSSILRPDLTKIRQINSDQAKLQGSFLELHFYTISKKDINVNLVK
jgi:hypothetical protein